MTTKHIHDIITTVILGRGNGVCQEVTDMDSNRKIDHELGHFIWTIIHNSGKSYEAVANELGVSVRSVSYYCDGLRKPKHKTLLRLMRIANVQAKDIPF